MGRIEKRVCIVVLAAFLLALGAMLLQTLLSGDSPTIYHITILLDGSDEAYWQNFRLGADRAARDRNADVRYVTRYEGAAAAAQVESLRQAWEGETDGVVLFPLDRALLEAALEDAPAGLAVTAVGAPLESGRVDCVISADPEEMGRRLADALAADGHTAVTLYRSAQETETLALRRQGFLRRLEELGVRCTTVTTSPQGLFVLPEGRAAAALEPAMTEALCQAASSPGQVYGIGSSDLLLHYLEEGTAAALVVQSDYEAGYLSLLSVLEALENGRPQDQTLDCYTVTAENLFTDPMDQILFPSA